MYGVVKEGTLTHNMSDCSIDGIYQFGASIAEPSGADHVHIGRNLGNTPPVMQVLYVDPGRQSAVGGRARSGPRLRLTTALARHWPKS